MFSAFFLLLSVISAGLIFIESFTYQGFIEKYVILNPQILVVTCLLLSILNLIQRQPCKLPEKIDKINTFIFLPLTLTGTLFFTFLEIITYPNFVFKNFHLHYEIIFFLFLTSLSIKIFNINRNKIKKNTNKFIFILSLFLIGILALIRTWPGGIFFTIIREDNLLENLQFIFYTFSSFLFFCISLKYFKTNKLYFFYFLLLGLFLFFVSGEEISWGQRILHITSPEVLKNNNAQNETTIHNIYGLQNLQPIMYMTFSVYLTFAWAVLKVLPYSIKNKLQILVPNRYFIFYFLPIFIFYFHINVLGGKHWEWQEACEFLLAVGLFLFGILTLKIKNPKNS